MKNYLLITTAMLVIAIISGTYFLYSLDQNTPRCFTSNIVTKLSEHQHKKETLGAYHVVSGFQEKIELIYIVPEPVEIDVCGNFNKEPIFSASSDYGYGEDGHHIKSVKVTKTKELEFTYTDETATALPEINVIWGI